MNDHKITLTYLNIRQSIAILLFKLIVADFVLAGVLIGFYFLLVQGEVFIGYLSKSTVVFLAVFSFIGLIKIFLTTLIVLQWLNEYYEITPDAIIHKKGIFIKTVERYSIEKLRSVVIHDTFFGELLNYATLTLYDQRLVQYLDMYLIHNPDRYVRVLQTLHPDLELKEDRYVFFKHKKLDLLSDNLQKEVNVYEKFSSV